MNKTEKKYIQAITDRGFETSFSTGRRAEIMKQFFAGVQDRINQGIPYTMRGM